MVSNLIKSKREYNRILENMRGVDASGRGGSKTKRYAYLENMYRDYSSERGELIESVPGFRKVYQGTAINGLHLQTAQNGDRYIIVNDNGKLLRYREGSPESITALTGSSTVEKAKSYSFNFEGQLFIGDGGRIYGINDRGRSMPVHDLGERRPYFPTVFLNGKEYEQRNLLSCLCYEKHALISPGLLIPATASLVYRVTSEEERLCSVCGISDSTRVVYIPAKVRLDGREYTVTAIDSNAFASNETVMSVTIADTVTSVGVGAFYECTALSTFIGGTGLREICDGAFEDSDLAILHIPAGFSSFGINAIPSDTLIRYELGESAYQSIKNLPQNSVMYGNTITSVPIGVAVRTKSREILSVKLGGEEIDSYNIEYDEEGYVRQLIIGDAKKQEYMGKTLEICLSADDTAYLERDDGEDFTKNVSKKSLAFCNVIRNCRNARAIGGRIFAWDNPNFPSVLFYSSATNTDGKLYFGSLDYIDIGGNILSVLPVEEGIGVFASRVDGGESILFCEEKEREGALSEKYYVITGRYRTKELSGAVASQNGESLYLTGQGLFAIGEKTVYESHRIYPRSSLIAPLLAKENLKEATITEWCGYTVVSTGGNLYLMDPRRSVKIEGEYEPEWFCIKGVGTYLNDNRVYRYASVAREGYLLSESPDERVTESVFSEGTKEGTLVYFIKKDGKKVEVYPTEEMAGGDFCPAKITLGFEDRLLFSTDSGAVCAFNTDMRGVAPEGVRSSPDFDAMEYSLRMGNRIHPYFYDFNLHAPRCALITAADDCGIPHLRKSTVNHSLTLKIATFPGGRLYCEVGRDGEGFKRVGTVDGGITDISSLSFLSVPFDSSETVTVAMHERERGWTEKSIAVYSDNFRSPIGVYSICYRYRISGRIRNS